MSRRSLSVLFVLVLATIAAVLVVLAVPLFTNWRLEDFAVTFYPAARYLARGENVYLNNYPQPDTGLQYPPYAPIWIFYAFVPFAAWPLPIAEAVRLLMDVAALPFLAYLCARWAGLGVWLGILLAAAPWLLTEISAGQMTPIVLIGVLLCYYGLKRVSAPMTAIGLLLALSKFTIVSLVVLATLLIAWRKGIFGRTLAILGGFAAVASLGSPTWIFDVVRLYIDRLSAPRLSDSVLLLPAYPWSQLALLSLSAIVAVGYLLRTRETQPTPWLWALLVCIGLVGALHTFVYDWQLLMLPLAFMLRDRRTVPFVLAVYLYSFVWAIALVVAEIHLPTPAIIPSVVMLALLAFPTYWKMAKQRAAHRQTAP